MVKAEKFMLFDTIPMQTSSSEQETPRDDDETASPSRYR
jgi:hypothetical protein